MGQPNSERDALIHNGLFGSAQKLHKVELDGTSDPNFARFKCQRCGATFAVGYRTVVGHGSGSQRLELIDRAALDRPCPGMVRVHGELKSESAEDADAVIAVANELSKRDAEWDVDSAERVAGASLQVPLVAVSWVWDSRDESASTEQAVEIFGRVFRGSTRIGLFRTSSGRVARARCRADCGLSVDTVRKPD